MKKILSFVLIMSICTFCFCGCTNKSDVVGVWKNIYEYDDGSTWYNYYYEDGTTDGCKNDGSGQHYNSTSWKIKGDSIIKETAVGATVSYIVKNDELLDQQGNVLAVKVSDDPSKTVEEIEQ